MLGPPTDCSACPRLAVLRAENRAAHPEWHNDPVPSFGDSEARLLIVGLAPGLRGANRTGRPFTGDFAGDLLYPTLLKFGLAEGDYGGSADDGLRLVDCRITNAVRCVPPANKPVAGEITACRNFLTDEIVGMSRLAVILALGTVAHGAVLAGLGIRKSAHQFGHGAQHFLVDGLLLVDSYHCSRYNTNTGRLTPAMFEMVFRTIKEQLDQR